MEMGKLLNFVNFCKFLADIFEKTIYRLQLLVYCVFVSCEGNPFFNRAKYGTMYMLQSNKAEQSCFFFIYSSVSVQLNW